MRIRVRSVDTRNLPEYRKTLKVFNASEIEENNDFCFYIDLSSLEELFKAINLLSSQVILQTDSDDINTIQVYDDYLE